MTSAAPARPSPRRICAATSRPRRSCSICNSASAITASSTDAAGRPKPTPGSATSSAPTVRHQFVGWAERSEAHHPRAGRWASLRSAHPTDLRIGSLDCHCEERSDEALAGQITGGTAMPLRSKVIITCAVTGSIHTPTMSPYLPLTPDEVARDAIAAAEAGAAILHLHARDPKDGRPTPDPNVFMQFLPRIKQATNAVINITTGGGHGMTLEERLAAPLRAKPEMCSMNMGSMNFGLYPMLDRYKEWKYEWEPQFLEMTRDFIFRNTFKDIERSLKELGEGCGTKFEFECYDVGHLYNLAHFLDRGLVKPPLFVQTIFGILGGIGADPENLAHMKRIADKLFGDQYAWSVLAAGRHQLPFVTMAAVMGGNVRVGLEDSIYVGRGKLAESNADQVKCVRAIVENLSLEIATPDEARAMLALKGGDAVAF